MNKHPLKKRPSLCNSCKHLVYAPRLKVISCGQSDGRYGERNVRTVIPVVRRCKFYEWGEHSSWVIPS